MMTRRTVLAGGACLTAAGPASADLPVPEGDRLGFNIVRKGSRIGTHILTFKRDGRTLRVDVAADIAVSFGPIVVFR